MSMQKRREARLAGGLAAALAAVLSGAPSAPVWGQELPARIADSTFWQMIVDLSEPGGYFRSDNFVSNETTFQYAIPELQRLTRPGGAYVGVGPEQNFTYIVALKPKIAFIIDIRRQNMLQHLMYKALLERAADRVEFLSLLFSRARAPQLDTAATVDALFGAYAGAPRDSAAFRRNLASLKERLTKLHGFKLTDDDLRSLDYVYSAFFDAGPDLNYNSSQGGFNRGRMPSYAEVMTAADDAGEKRSYLATEANFRALKDLETRNLVVPVVGDFGGPKAIRAVGQYLRQRGATVTVFYTSNVEQYLFQGSDLWRRFFTNVGTMPLDAGSTFVRAVFNGMAFRNQTTFPMMRSQTMLASIQEQLKAFADGRIADYGDVIQLSRESPPPSRNPPAPRERYF
jgi:hypothetical protein